MALIIKTVYLFVMALVLAAIEIQIEGKDGWACNLPTWRPNGDSKAAKIYSKVMSGKPMTGYHLAVFCFVVLILHYPFFSGTLWSWAAEFETIAMFFIFSVVWDLLWFVLNPCYGIKKMGVEHGVWWHSKRWFGVPRDYYSAIIFSFLLYLPLGAGKLLEWAEMLGIFVLLTIITILLNPEEREKLKED